MDWQLSDLYGIEDELMAMGLDVWSAWVHDVRPRLLEDPSPTNPSLRITETHTQQVWIPGTDVYVVFFPTSDNHVMLMSAVNLLDELG